MWTESLKIRLSMTAVWLALAACLLLAARFMTPASGSVPSVAPTDVSTTPVAVRVADPAPVPISENAG